MHWGNCWLWLGGGQGIASCYPGLLPSLPGCAPHSPHSTAAPTCGSGEGQLPGWQDFLQAPPDSLFFKEFRYLLLTVLGPDAARVSSTSGLSHGPGSWGGLHAVWGCTSSCWWSLGPVAGVLREQSIGGGGSCLETGEGGGESLGGWGMAVQQLPRPRGLTFCRSLLGWTPTSLPTKPLEEPQGSK